jgi:hypothetical protein
MGQRRDLNNRINHPAGALITPEEALEQVAQRLLVGAEVADMIEWEIVGGHTLALAERDAKDWPTHADEYVGAYVAEVFTLLRRRPDVVANASRPWGVLVNSGRRAGQYAVSLEALGGLTGRDPVNHRVRLSDVPRVVSLESLAELGGDQ